MIKVSDYAEGKARVIREHCLSHPWREVEQRILVMLVEQMLLDQRKRCAAAILNKFNMSEMPERVLNTIVHAEL